jgi:hypothetical protein
VTGSTPGSNLVSGDRYIEVSFNYYHTHLWRNYGILVSYLAFFFVLYGLAVEFVPQVVKGKGDVLIFLRRRRAKQEWREKGQSQVKEKCITVPAKSASTTHRAPEGLEDFGKLERSRGNFTWDAIEYKIPVKGGSKTLLTGINGYVKPGSMTGTPHYSGLDHVAE